MKKVYPSREKCFFIFCDDIRQEVGNKPSLMGWYSNNDIIFHSERMITPLAIAFAVYDGEGEFNVRFEIENPKHEVKISGDLGNNRKFSEKAMVVISKISQIEFSDEGIHKVKFYLDNEPYEEELAIKRISKTKKN